MEILKFSAKWCEPCKAYSPVFMDWLQTYESRIKATNIDVEDSPEVANKYRVMSIPVTILLNDDGIEIKRKVGPMTKQELVEFIK